MNRFETLSTLNKQKSITNIWLLQHCFIASQFASSSDVHWTVVNKWSFLNRLSYYWSTRTYHSSFNTGIFTPHNYEHYFQVQSGDYVRLYPYLSDRCRSLLQLQLCFSLFNKGNDKIMYMVVGNMCVPKCISAINRRRRCGLTDCVT